jgi:hypothetical protein
MRRPAYYRLGREYFHIAIASTPIVVAMLTAFAIGWPTRGIKIARYETQMKAGQRCVHGSSRNSLWRLARSDGR